MIEAFSDYGFPESHAQSMAYIIYASAWINYHYPGALIAGILAHQPMGFYDSQTLIGDAERHGITVRPADIQTSGVHVTLEPDSEGGKMAIRRGLTSIRGLSEHTAQAIVATRSEQPFTDLEDVARRTRLAAKLMEQLATAGALAAFDGHRRTTLWTAGAFPRTTQPYLPGLGALTPAPDLPPMTPAEETAASIEATGASTTTHSARHARPYLEHRGALTAAVVKGLADQTRVRIGGLAKYLQRPPTANGVAFGALEDETGMVNLVFSPPVWERCRRTLLEAPPSCSTGTSNALTTPSTSWSTRPRHWPSPRQLGHAVSTDGEASISPFRRDTPIALQAAAYRLPRERDTPADPRRGTSSTVAPG